MADKKIVGFKKFSDIKASSKVEEVDPSMYIRPEVDSDRPANPNLSKPVNKVERISSRKNIIPEEQTVLDTDNEFSENEELDDSRKNEQVKTYGKVAKFPNGVKASKAFNFMESVKISKKSIWYLLIENQSDELQMVKYNYKEGVDLNKFVNELKGYYINKNKDNKSICEAVSKIGVDGNDKFSKITNIAKIKVDGKLLITKITEDLISLLSK